MVWGAIAYGWRGSLIFILKNHRTDKDYVSMVLTGVLLLFYKKVVKQRGQIYVVEDGAPVHRCAAAKNFRESNQVCSLSHPPQSPDMNPIEHVWKSFKTNINKHSKHSQNAVEFENMNMEA